MTGIEQTAEFEYAPRYDGATIAFHWITALLVLVLFGSAMAWTYLPRDWGLRWLQGIHISLGVALAATLIARLGWRMTAGRRLPAAGKPAIRILSQAVHWALYSLLVVQVCLGFGARWLDGHGVSFFGLFTIDSPIAGNRGLGHQFEDLHGIVAWTIIILAGGHSLAALFHRYLLSDGVLRRMLPIGPK